MGNGSAASVLCPLTQSCLYRASRKYICHSFKELIDGKTFVLVFLTGKSSVFCIFLEALVFLTLYFSFFFFWPVMQKKQMVMLCQVTSRGRRHNSPLLVTPRQDSKILICFFSSLEAHLWPQSLMKHSLPFLSPGWRQKWDYPIASGEKNLFCSSVSTENYSFSVEYFKNSAWGVFLGFFWGFFCKCLWQKQRQGSGCQGKSSSKHILNGYRGICVLWEPEHAEVLGLCESWWRKEKGSTVVFWRSTMH